MYSELAFRNVVVLEEVIPIDQRLNLISSSQGHATRVIFFSVSTSRLAYPTLYLGPDLVRLANERLDILLEIVLYIKTVRLQIDIFNSRLSFDKRLPIRVVQHTQRSLRPGLSSSD